MIGQTGDAETTEVKEFLTSLIGNAPIGILALDMESRCILANGWAATVLGTHPEQLVDCHLDQLLAHWPEFEDCLPQNQPGGRTDFDLHAVKRGCQVYDISCRTIVSGTLLTIHDITEEIRIREEQARLVQHLEHANRELAEFAYICAHDMKSPISNLVGLLQHVEDCDGIQGDAKTLFELMKQSTEGLDTKIRSLNDMLAVKQTLGKSDETSSLVVVLDEVRKSMLQDLNLAGAVVNIEAVEDSILSMSNPHLHSILHNLLSNAVKFRHADRRPEIIVRAKQSGDDTLIEISDNGIGFDVKRGRAKIFGLFNRLHTHVEGTGIGLYLVKSIIESYGGRVTVDSVEQSGTIFRLELPHAP